ncbi:MAG: dihydrolipoamide acetyltransferase family protein [Verrucomicrobiia bacterium]
MAQKIPIIMPQLGESIAEAAVVNFLAKVGEPVLPGQEVLEVETNKATMAVTSPCKGILSEWIVKINESYPVGSVLGYIDAEVTVKSPEQQSETGKPKVAVSEEKTPSAAKEPSQSEQECPKIQALPQQQGVFPTVRGLPVPAPVLGASYMSPRLKARMAELGLNIADLAGIKGSGAGGRITVEDFERYIAYIEKQKQTKASSMRVAVADAMRRSWTRPLATVGLYASLDKILQHRKGLLPKPGPSLYGLRALAIALAENSAPAGRLIGNVIVHPPAIDIGIAVEAEDGVLVPVIRNADKKSLKELVPIYNELITLARQRRLPADAIGGSIATISNYGTFGLVWATPIPLPEQTLVLGLGAGVITPVWNEESKQFVPATLACLTLSFDHRVLDGGAAGRLLNRIAELLSKPEEL